MLKPFKTRVVKLLSIIAPLLFLASCSPSKGYLGPTLPPEELAIVYYGACDNGSTIGKASSEGVEFDSSGIALLPGKRMIYVSAELIFSYSTPVPGSKSALRKRLYLLSAPASIIFSSRVLRSTRISRLSS